MEYLIAAIDALRDLVRNRPVIDTAEAFEQLKALDTQIALGCEKAGLSLPNPPTPKNFKQYGVCRIPCQYARRYKSISDPLESGQNIMRLVLTPEWDQAMHLLRAQAERKLTSRPVVRGGTMADSLLHDALVSATSAANQCAWLPGEVLRKIKGGSSWQFVHQDLAYLKSEIRTAREYLDALSAEFDQIKLRVAFGPVEGESAHHAALKLAEWFRDQIGRAAGVPDHELSRFDLAVIEKNFEAVAKHVSTLEVPDSATIRDQIQGERLQVEKLLIAQARGQRQGQPGPGKPREGSASSSDKGGAGRGEGAGETGARRTPNESTEQPIIDALFALNAVGLEGLKAIPGSQRPTGERLAPKAIGRSCDGQFKATLAHMVDLGWLGNGRDHGLSGGYFLTEAGAAYARKRRQSGLGQD
jgi:hypothetical protein